MEDLKKETGESLLHQGQQRMSTLQMLKRIAFIFFPTIMTEGLALVQDIVNLLFIGFLDDSSKLAGAGMASSLIAVTMLVILYGLNQTLDSFVPQAFGNGKLEMCGVYLHRARLIITLVCLPLILLLTKMEAILVAIGMHAESSKYAQQFAWGLVPATYLFGLFDCQRRFLSCLDKAHGAVYAQALGVILHPILCWVFVIKYDFDVFGPGIAAILTNLSIFCFILCYTYSLSDIREAVFLPDRRMFQGLGEFLKLGIPSTLMLASEWWANDFITFLTGYLGKEHQAAQIIIFNYTLLIYCIMLGLQSSASVNVGRSLGEEKISQAKRFHSLIFKCMAATMVLVIAFAWTFKLEFFRLFSTEQAILDLCLQVAPFTFLQFIPDFIQTTANGTIRALSLQDEVLAWTMFGYWVVTFSVVGFCCFYLDLGLIGVALGNNSSFTFFAVYYCWKISVADWELASQKAKERGDDDW